MKLSGRGMVSTTGIRSPLSGAPGLRIDPIMMRPEDPRGHDFHANRIEGLDYEFMQEQGWLFPCEPPRYEWLCRPAGSEVATTNFKFVASLIQHPPQEAA